jgi:hypothetical protein
MRKFCLFVHKPIEGNVPFPFLKPWSMAAEAGKPPRIWRLSFGRRSVGRWRRDEEAEALTAARQSSNPNPIYAEAPRELCSSNPKIEFYS